MIYNHRENEIAPEQINPQVAPLSRDIGLFGDGGGLGLAFQPARRQRDVVNAFVLRRKSAKGIVCSGRVSPRK